MTDPMIEMTRPGQPAHVATDALYGAAVDLATAFPPHLVLAAMLDAFVALAEQWELPSADAENALRCAADGVAEAYGNYAAARLETAARLERTMVEAEGS